MLVNYIPVFMMFAMAIIMAIAFMKVAELLGRGARRARNCRPTKVA